MIAPASDKPKRRGLLVAVSLNVVLVLLLCAMALYAFMLNVDLGDLKRNLSKEVESRERTEHYLVETRNQLTESLGEIEQLKAQIAYKDTDVRAVAEKPPLPVVVHFRASLLGKGLVAVIDNTGDRYLTVVLTVRNPTLSIVKRFNLDLDPQSSTDFGHFEGWQFNSGDELELFNEEFGVLKLTVP